MNVAQCQEIEHKVIRFSIKQTLDVGYGLRACDGDEATVINSTDPEFIFKAMVTSGEHDLIVTNPGTNYAEAFIRFI
jgi:hypothetical protein